MSDLETSSDFTTSILTSKTPEQSALLVNEGVRQFGDLSKLLINFFENYVNVLQKQNYEAKNLLASQAAPISKLLSSRKEYGLFTSVWDQYTQNLNLNINSTDHLIKFLKLEILSPLVKLTNNDISYSELLINNQELSEIASETPVDEYKWNSRALQILENFKSFKLAEKNLLLGQFISLLNASTAESAKLQTLNENALNFALSNFNLNSEMDNYLNVLLNTNYPPLAKKASAAPVAVDKGKKSNRQSKILAAEKEPKKDKVKLRSKIGSVFGGRKRKSKKSTDLESIYSNQTANTNLTSLTNLREDDPERDTSRRQVSEPSYAYPVGTRQGTSQSLGQQTKSQPPIPPIQTSANTTTPIGSLPAYQANGFDAPQHPSLAPRKASSSSSKNPNRDLPILPAFSAEPEANVVKYSDDSLDDENERRPSLLQENNLDLPQPDGNFSGNRHTQYSFEMGDDLKNFQTSPKVQRQEKFDYPEPDVADPHENGIDVDHPFAQQSPQIPETLSLKSGTQSHDGGVGSSPVSAPAPPPARKVVHHDTKRSEIQSQLFHSLPNTRNSVIEPPRIHQPLTSQVTGSSLASTSKAELFNHSELIYNLAPGLNISNSQVINVNFKQDSLNKASIIGELAFNYQGNSSGELDVHIPNKYDRVILNNTFVEKKDQSLFTINPALILGKTLGGIKYMENSLDVSQIPVFVHSIWKFEPHQASLMINLKLNTNFASSVSLNNLVVSVALKHDVEATSASSRPTGTFNKEKNRITWRYTHAANLTAESPDEKLIARFMTNGTASEDDSGIQLNFSIFNHLQNNVTSNNQLVNCISNMNAGNYSTNS